MDIFPTLNHQSHHYLHLVSKKQMNRFYLLLLLTIASLISCKEKMPTSPTDRLANYWNMAAILRNSQDVSDQHNPENNRWIELHADGTFTSDGDPYGRNTGKWILDENTMELFLDSDTGEGDDSYWIVSFNEDEVLLKGTRSDFTQQFSMLWKAGELGSTP